ncbi:MAG: PEP-CTERM sorting domain-containing protein [Candidatus Didemnitutus sp.]|nr:PEP-CTERM sorting domain-containing protein [Candidatus Didemnitutus sp.]
MKKTLLLTLLALPVLAFGQATTVFNEAFASGQRMNFSAGTSAQWYTSSSVGNLVEGTGFYQQNTGTAGRQLLGYFTAPGNGVTIAQNQQLIFTFTVTLNTAGADFGVGDKWRVGLFDSSAGSRVSADNTGGTNTTVLPFENYKGYGSFLAPGANAETSAKILERTTLTGQPLIASGTPYTTVGDTIAAQAMTAGSPYVGTFSIGRDANDALYLTMTYTGVGLNNYTMSVVDTSAATFSFDTFAFIAGSNAVANFAISQALVQTAPFAPIPEPSTYAAIAGALSLVGVMVWRRRRQT